MEDASLTFLFRRPQYPERPHSSSDFVSTGNWQVFWAERVILPSATTLLATAVYMVSVPDSVGTGVLASVSRSGPE